MLSPMSCVSPSSVRWFLSRNTPPTPWSPAPPRRGRRSRPARSGSSGRLCRQQFAAEKYRNTSPAVDHAVVVEIAQAVCRVVVAIRHDELAPAAAVSAARRSKQPVANADHTGGNAQAWRDLILHWNGRVGHASTCRQTLRSRLSTGTWTAQTFNSITDQPQLFSTSSRSLTLIWPLSSRSPLHPEHKPQPPRHWQQVVDVHRSVAVGVAAAAVVLEHEQHGLARERRRANVRSRRRQRMPMGRSGRFLGELFTRV